MSPPLRGSLKPQVSTSIPNRDPGEEVARFIQVGLRLLGVTASNTAMSLGVFALEALEAARMAASASQWCWALRTWQVTIAFRFLALGRC